MGRAATLVLACALSSTTACATLRQGAEDVAGFGVGLNASDPHRFAAEDGVGAACSDGSLVWIVPVDGGVVLVDAGFDESGAAVRAALHRRRVLAVLLTHAHPDHIAAAGAFAAPVYVGRADVPLLSGRHAVKDLAVALASALLAPPVPRTVIPVDDGFTLVVGGRTFRAVAVPGHTPGSTAWLRGGLLFTGDAAVSPRGRAVVPPPEPYSEDPARARASLRRLADRAAGLGVTEILDGHYGRVAVTPALWAASLARVHAADAGDEVDDGGRPWGCALKTASAASF